MFVMKAALQKFLSSHNRSILPVVLPWFGGNSISIPRERLTLLAQLGKLSSIAGRDTPDSRKLAGMYASAEASFAAAALLYDTVIEDIRAAGMVTPKLTAHCELAAIPAPAAHIKPPAEPRHLPLKEAA